MRKMNNLLKVFVFVLFAIAAASCGKDDPYAGYTAEREAKLIKEWQETMVKNNKDIDTTSTGLFYIMDKEGSGATVKSGDEVKVKYTGMFIDGTVFDASSLRGDGTMTYEHKGTDSRMIQGWEEGIEVLNKGAIAVFLIPSAKAYGPAGYSSIPPYSPLLFIIEVVDIN